MVSSTSGLVSVYDNCAVFDLRNWECSEDNGTLRFGIRDGAFWEVVPTSSIADTFKSVRMPELQYHILGCKWDAVDGGLQLIACALRPFIE